MAYTSTSFSFSEQPSAAKWNQLGSNDAYFDSLIGSGTAWTAYTPTVTGPATNGNAVITGAYQQLGKNVHFYMKYTLGSTTDFTGLTSFIVSLPVVAAAAFGGATNLVFGSGIAIIAGTGYAMGATNNNTTSFQAFAYGASFTNLVTTGCTPTVPGTWANGSSFGIFGMYQAA